MTLLDGSDRRLIRLVSSQEVAVSTSLPGAVLAYCAGGCFRMVEDHIKLCLHCRNTSSHPALWARRRALNLE